MNVFGEIMDCLGFPNSRTFLSIPYVQAFLFLEEFIIERLMNKLSLYQKRINSNCFFVK